MIGLEHDPSDVTRILFRDFPVWMMVAFYIAAISAIGAFCYGTYAQIRKYRRGARSGAWSPFWPRFIEMVGVLLSHRMIKRRDTVAGVSHAWIFFGFALLFIGTSIITLEYDILEPLTGLRFWHGSFYLIFSLVVDFAGVALIVGLLYMMYRRKWLAPPKLDYARPDRTPDEPDYDRSFYRMEDWAFLWTLILIAITGYLLEAFAAGLAAVRADGLGLSLVVAVRRGDGPCSAGPGCRRRGGWGSSPGSLVVPRTPGLRFHRTDSLYQGEAHLHGHGLAHGHGP